MNTQNIAVLSTISQHNGNMTDFTNTFAEISTCDFKLSTVFSALRLYSSQLFK